MATLSEPKGDKDVQASARQRGASTMVSKLASHVLLFDPLLLTYCMLAGLQVGDYWYRCQDHEE